MSANRAATNFSSVAFAATLGLLACLTLGIDPLGAQPKSQPNSPPKKAEVPQAPDDSGEDVSVATPKEWKPEPELAATLLPNFLKTVELGELDARGGAAAYVGPQIGAVYVSWAKARKQSDNPAQTAREVLERLRAEPKNASSDVSEIEEINYKELKNGEAIEARLAWRHKGNEIITSSRTLIWLNKDKLLRVLRGECVFSEEDAEKVTPMCAGVLKSVVADDLKNGVALSLGAVPAQAVAKSDPAAPTDAEPTKPGPTISSADPGGRVLYEDKKAGKPKKSRNWMFLLGGILVVFALWSVFRAKSDDSDDSSSAANSEEEE